MHADDTHAERFENSLPCHPLLSAFTDSFLFRERLRPSHPPVFFLPGTCEEKTAGQRIRAGGDKRAHDGLTLGAEESVFLVPHVPTIAPRCPTAVIVDKIKLLHFQKESKKMSAYHKRPALIIGVSVQITATVSAERATTIQHHTATFEDRPSAQSFPENAGSYGSGFAGTSVGSASHATYTVLAEVEGSILGLASGMPPRNCDSGLCISPGWRDPFWLKQGVTLDTAHRRKVVTTDVSNKGWGVLCEGKPTFCLWSEKESGLHINCLEMIAVCQACEFFLPDIRGHHVLVRSAIRSVVSYIKHQSGCILKRLCMLANNLLVWAQNNLHSLKACAGQVEPWSRHVFKKQCLLRGMDAPPTCGLENVGSLWQSSSRPLRL